MQITLCTKWRKNMQSTTKLFSERYSDTSSCPTSSSQSKPLKKQLKVIRGFKLTKCMTSDGEIKSQIPESDRSTEVLKTVEDEPQSSSTLGPNWNVETDSLIVCRETEQYIPAK